MANTDPRRLGGDIAGPGVPHGHGDVVIDTRNAVLLDHTGVALMDGEPPIMCLTLAGRINKQKDRAKILFLMDGDGAAGIVTELFGLIERMGPKEGERFLLAVKERILKLP